MRLRPFFALVLSTGTSPALAQEAAGTTALATPNPTPAPAPARSPFAHDDGFAAPNGQYGAGLSISAPEGMRMYAELGFFSISDSFAGVIDVHETSLSLLVGGGYKIGPDLEIEVMLPFSMAHVSVESNDPNITIPGDNSQTGWAVGNLHLGASYIHAQEPKLRMKLGGAVEWGPWTIDPSDKFTLALALPPPAYAAHDLGLWAWETLSIVTPAHIEWGDQAVITGDGSLGLHIPTDGRDVEISVQLDPGFGIYAKENVLLGARLPFVWIPTEGGDNAQVAIEPYARLDFGSAFANARFTLNLDDPYGFGFDEGKVWAIHVGFGGSF